MLAKQETKLIKSCDKAMKKIVPEWKWKPEAGDIFEYRFQEMNRQFERVWYKEMKVVPSEFQVWSVDSDRYMAFCKPGDYMTRRHYFLPYCTPALHWEKIEKLLKKSGYYCNSDSWIGRYIEIYGVWIVKDSRHLVYATGITRQEAIMKAVVELSKEMKNDSI